MLAEKHRLEDQLVKLNMEAKDKNGKILDLLESIEDLKIQVYSRDKSIELQQQQIEQLIEDLREAKQFEHQCKMLQIMNTSLEKENQRLQAEADAKLQKEVESGVETVQKNLVQQTLADQVTELKGELDERAKKEQAATSKVVQMEQALKKKLDAAAAEVEVAQKK